MQLLLKIKKNVNYYDYKNIFVAGNQKRIEEYYGKGGFDPIGNKYGYDECNVAIWCTGCRNQTD